VREKSTRVSRSSHRQFQGDSLGGAITYFQPGLNVPFI